MKYIFLIIPFFVFAQNQIDLSEMTGNVLFGDEIGFEPICSDELEVFNVGDIDFNGYQIILNGVQLIVDGDVEFGGSFRGYCDSVLCINGTVFNSDPPDPGGDPFSDPGIEYPSSFEANKCVNLPNDVSGWYGISDLFRIPNETLSVPSYDRVTNVWKLTEADQIFVFDLSGRELIQGSKKVDLSAFKSQILIIKTNVGNFKVLR